MKSMTVRRTGQVARMGETINACKLLIEEPKGKRQFGKARHKWEDDIKMNLEDVVWEGVD
jgi:hypothetical protein